MLVLVSQFPVGNLEEESSEGTTTARATRADSDWVEFHSLQSSGTNEMTPDI